MSESVWDYPRPPALDTSGHRARVMLGGRIVADTRRALRVLETSHPPTIYIPPEDIEAGVLGPSAAPASVCEFKGRARYLDAPNARAVAWSYPDPTAAFAALRDHVAFYPGRVEGAWLDDEAVQAQAGDFYGGWVTSAVRGPFKGAPGTLGW